jgi:hypothetical protein
METIKRFSLTAADLMVAFITINESTAISGHFTVTDGGRRIVLDKLSSILHGMEATFTINEDEPQ